MDELYKDLLKDGKHERRLLVMGWIITAVFAICAIVGLSMYYQNKYSQLMTEMEFESSYTIMTDNQSVNNGNLSVER